MGGRIGKPAVVLDRDGVINEYRMHVNRPDDLHIYSYAAEAIGLLNKAGFYVLVATNQGGIGLGYLSEADLAAIHERMQQELREQGARIDGIAYCPHAPGARCPCRKPRPGMLYDLQRRYAFDFRRSYMVGDRETDVACGRTVGMKTILIHEFPTQTAADYTAIDLLQAAKWILTQTNGKFHT
ncbi:MAG: HAD family hydrolase [Alicyclobacillus macrosporangiidus]|nr:HAD family hydrolase [Alicyclobacillus macrosporangiidus]